jgi:peptide/nickel transport system permease protein
MLMVASPIDPVQAYVGADLARLGPEQRAAIESAWGLDQPLLTRLFAWATTLATGDLGHSIVFHQPVTQVIAERFIASLALMTVAWVLSAVLGFAMGALAGWFHGRWPDRIVTWWAYTLASAPTFWVGLLLLYVFAVTLGIAPVCCSAPIGSLASDVPLWQRLHHLVLPALTVSIVGVAPVALHTRHAVIETLGSDHISLARAQGERGWGLARHHVLRNAAGPALMLSFASFGELFGGSVLAEQVFSYPGLGEATVTAALRQDVPLLLGVVMFTTVFVYAGNLIGDVVHHVSDPRVPLEPERRPS